MKKISIVLKRVKFEFQFSVKLAFIGERERERQRQRKNFERNIYFLSYFASYVSPPLPTFVSFALTSYFGSKNHTSGGKIEEYISGKKTFSR